MSDGVSDSQRLREGVAEEVKVLLIRKRMTAEELAATIGRSPMYVSRRLRGEVAFDVDDLERIAAALNVLVIQLLPRTALQPTTKPITANEGYGPGDNRPPATGRTTRSVATPQPKRRPKAVSSPGRGTPKQSTRRPAILPRMIRV